MSKLKPSLIDRLNRLSRGGKLGEHLNNALSKTGMKVEAVTGKVNTGYGLIDDCEAVNMDVESAPTIFHATLVSDKFFKGTKSVQLESLTATATLGQTILNEISSENWSASDRIGFWVFSNIPLAAGNVRFVVHDNVAGAQYVNLPAIESGKPVWIELDISAMTRTAVIKYGFERKVAKLFKLKVDHITRFADDNTVVLSEVPVERTRSDEYPSVSSVDLSAIKTAETEPNTPSVLVEGTDYLVGADAKRIIFLTDQSAKSLLAHYAY